MNEVSIDQDVIDADSRIVGSDTEDNSHSEGLIRYDLVFDACVPNTEEIIRLIINVEIQVDVDPGYSIITRGIYYLARLISRQKGTVFTGSDYGKIRKVYSIWICPDPRKEKRNSIAEYGFTQQKVIGKVDEPVENYDKMKAIIINLNDDGIDNRSDIIRLLSTLLSTNESVEKRKEILENDFHIPMTKEIEEGMQDMCNYGEALQRYGEQRGLEQGLKRGLERGLEQGRQEGIDISRLETIRNLKETLKMTTKQVMDAMRLSEEEKKKYAKMV